MAKPILTIAQEEPSPLRTEQAAMTELMAALTEHHKGLEQGLELVDLLHEKGLLDIVIALLKRGDRVLEIIIRAAEKPGGLSLMKNAIALVQGMSELDAKALVGLFRQVNAGLTAMNAEDRPVVTGAWSLLGLLRDEDVSAGLGVLFGFLKGFGHAVKEAANPAEPGAGSGASFAFEQRGEGENENT
ncbi:DUF1641 domain-containing protein [Alicyclobacillus cycloheptanicus]|uniref:Uncharacterized protein YjgD (DUF1641 family) n=1 Tax=Alicyclobacillus cycloheptanicus TaxID=1457 RepID=A0ABT9XGH8_9BACL|nr:DUF1641 domain-containing protein [Alicyclobacillus cycloheptanicus]MDQ0189169.1 uncharacterized protein YjgD (DUF1641 family) [Alicyclobacillus cycloheptanicus]WDM00359.1 DUF1641 domain-containing protein [Alicyclobacillus cycloheptanicus]